MAYKLSKYAEKDIKNILVYTMETWGRKQFKKYRKLLEESIQLVGEQPEVSTSRKREELFAGGRSYAFGKHIIFYRLKNDVVEIVRILYERMDFLSHIPDEYT